MWTQAGDLYLIQDAVDLTTLKESLCPKQRSYTFKSIVLVSNKRSNIGLFFKLSSLEKSKSASSLRVTDTTRCELVDQLLAADTSLD